MNLPAINATKCPQCGFTGPAASECQRCGVVYAKYRQGEESSAPGSRKDAARDSDGQAARPPRFTLFPWLLGLLAVIALAIGLDAIVQEGTAPGEPALATAEPNAAEIIPTAVSPRPTVPAPDSQPLFEPGWAPVETSDPTSVPAPNPQRSPTPSYSWYEGARGFERGIEEAEREGKALAVYFYTDWCPYCRELEHELLTRAKVEDFLKHLVKIRVNPESGSRERILANEYGVRGYPSFFIQTAPGAPPRKIRRSDSYGLKSPEEFVATLQRAAR